MRWQREKVLVWEGLEVGMVLVWIRWWCRVVYSILNHASSHLVVPSLPCLGDKFSFPSSEDTPWYQNSIRLLFSKYQSWKLSHSMYLRLVHRCKLFVFCSVLSSCHVTLAMFSTVNSTQSSEVFHASDNSSMFCPTPHCPLNSSESSSHLKSLWNVEDFLLFV